MSPLSQTLTTRRGLAVAAVLAALALAGCGSGGHVGGHLDQSGQTTPDDAVSMSAAVNGNAVLISPSKQGAGQMIFNVVNNDATATSLVARPAAGGGPAVEIGKVPANGTYQTKVDLRPGTYLIGSPYASEATAGSGYHELKPAKLTVGGYRSGGDSSISQP